MLAVPVSSVAQVTFETDYLVVRLDKTGQIRNLTDKKSGREYLPTGQPAPLLSLYKTGGYVLPVSMNFSAKKGVAVLRFTNGSEANIKIQQKGAYLRMELVSLTARDGVEAAVWGPYPVSIGKLIGETVGVIRDERFAVGVQSLRTNTIEGIPDDGDEPGGGTFYDPLPGQHMPENLKSMVGTPVTTDVNRDGDMPEYVRIYRGSAAVKRPYGGELRFYARDRRSPRILKTNTNIQEVKPIESDLLGSAIALFGCPEPKTLDMIEKIELGEGLPHPMLNGVWIKRSQRVGDAYMLYEGKDLNQSLVYARDLNFKLIHIGDVFKSWGHFGLESSRFDGSAALRAFTDKAKKDSISIGIHTLTTFTGTNDPYVSPVPSDSLLKLGNSVLLSDISESDNVIRIKDASFFHNPTSTKTIQIGKELISYKAVTGAGPWELTGCVRGQFKTQKSPHKAGETVSKLLNNGYGGFLPDINLQDRYATRLAAVCNETGIDLMDFDGFEGLDGTGHGAFAENKFVDLWYKNLDRYRITCGSNTSHYYWHIYSFMNWGEPWYSGLRKSQVNYRIENQRYFERNLMPGMLGWFKMEETYRPEEIEWIQARSAGFNAGYLLRVDESIENNGYKPMLFEAVREWQKARRLGVFSAEQRERLKNPANEFHLEKISDKSWDLVPVVLATGFEHQYRQVQTGEPIVSKFKLNNVHKAQPSKFYIICDAIEGNKTASVGELSIEINGQSIELSNELKAGDRVVCDGFRITLCDSRWNKVQTIDTTSLPVWKPGENTIVVKSKFSEPKAVSVKFEFKLLGEKERVGLN